MWNCFRGTKNSVELSKSNVIGQFLWAPTFWRSCWEFDLATKVGCIVFVFFFVRIFVFVHPRFVMIYGLIGDPWWVWPFREAMMNVRQWVSLKKNCNISWSMSVCFGPLSVFYKYVFMFCIFFLISTYLNIKLLSYNLHQSVCVSSCWYDTDFNLKSPAIKVYFAIYDGDG